MRSPRLRPSIPHALPRFRVRQSPSKLQNAVHVVEVAGKTKADADDTELVAYVRLERLHRYTRV